MVARRVGGEPLEQIVGWAEFAGQRIVVAPGVFVPRRRHRDDGRAGLAPVSPHGTVLDLGCGTGAVGAALRAGLRQPL